MKKGRALGPTKLRRCPKCGRDKKPCAFLVKFKDPDGWCRRCRFHLVPDEGAAPTEWFDIKLGPERVVRVRVVSDVVALTCGRTVERDVHEDWSGCGSWRVERASESFVEGATITVPLRKLGELRAALSQVAKAHPQAAWGGYGLK